MEIAPATIVARTPALNGDNDNCSRGDALTSSNGLALLASLTLKKALKVEISDNQLLQYSKITDTISRPYTCQLEKQYYSHQVQSQQSLPNGMLSNISSLDTKKRTITLATAKASDSATTILTTAKITKSLTPLAHKGSSSIVTNTAINTKSVVTTSAEATNAATIPSSVLTATANKHNFQIPSDILDDLASRFIINVPDMELSNLIRICFQVELAYWFYLDFFCASDEEKKLQQCGIKQFAMQLFQHIPFLRAHLSTIDKVLEDWKNYKLSVPTFGGILISEDLNYCLLVQSYFAKSSWGFPKGKVNENEDPEHCAAREVYEETGYDITELIVPNDYIEAVINYQYTRLYIVRNVSLSTQFSPRTRNEIKCCDWFPIDSLPINKNDAVSKAKLGINANSFFMIMPFVKRLKKWVNDNRKDTDATVICGTANSATVAPISGSCGSTATTVVRRKHSISQQLQQQANVVQIGSNSNKIHQTGVATISTSPKSHSPLTISAIAATLTANVSCNNNPKHINNNNNNCKRNKQQRHNISIIKDDKNVLNSIATAGIIETNTMSNNNNININNGSNTTSLNRSKRQRHKSMGDLDGIKLNNLSQQQQQSINTKITNNIGITTSPLNYLLANSNYNASNNNKRNSSKIVIGSITNNNNNNCNGITIKRQLFHSQSHHLITQQQQQGEKIVSSFDLIRKEKQQQIKAAKAQKQHFSQLQQQQKPQIQLQQHTNQNDTNNGNIRVRAKSQGDKICMQHNQQYHLNKHSSKQRVQKSHLQQTIINNSGHKSFENASIVTRVATIMTGPIETVMRSTVQTLPPTTDAEIASAVVFPIAEKSRDQEMQSISTSESVAEHYAIAEPTATTLGVQRMASDTELRILKRANSQQLTQQQYQQLKFTPSFNSWTNFSFTKNFITNVFC